MNYITQAELDALAADANAVLLPIVNAIHAQFYTTPGAPFLNNAYSKWQSALASGIISEDINPGIPVNPQPPYSFAPVVSVPLVSPTAVYDGSGNYSLTVASAGDYNLVLGANDISMTVPPPTVVSLWGEGAFIYDYSTNNLHLTAGTTVTFQGLSGMPVTVTLALSTSNHLCELNRIRGDAMALLLGFNGAAFPGGESLYLNTASVNSGPWVVGVSDDDTYPLHYTAIPYRGALRGELTRAVEVFSGGGFVTEYWATGLPLFKEVDFVAADMPAGLTIDTALRVVLAGDGVFNYTLSGSGTLKLTSWLHFICSGTPTTADFVVVASGVTAPSLSIINDPLGGVNHYILIGSSSTSISSSGSFTYYIGLNLIPRGSSYDGSGHYTVAGNFSGWDGVPLHCYGTDWTLNTGGAGGHIIVAADATSITIGGPPSSAISDTLTRNATLAYTIANVALTADMVFSTASTQVVVNGLHPASAVKAILCVDVPDGDAFSLNGTVAEHVWILSDPSVKGIWTAITLPSPGNNVFIDADIPPYIGKIVSAFESSELGPIYLNIAVAGNGMMIGRQSPNPSAAPWASSMRQAAPIQLSPTTETLVDGVNSVKPGITTRAAKWLTRRDTDFVPWNLGFNASRAQMAAPTVTVYRNRIVAGGALNYYNIAVSPSITKIYLRLVQAGTVPGWKWNAGTGVWQWGEPLAVALNILVKQSGYPTLPVGFDFQTTNNEVTIDPDGGGSYLATVSGTGFAFAVYNTGVGAVEYDLYTEMDIGVPERNYFPPATPYFDVTKTYADKEPAQIGDGNAYTSKAGGNTGNTPPNATWWTARDLADAAECFSFNINGTPGNFSQFAGTWGNGDPISAKPIPKMGYCIFSVRATRLPILNPNGISYVPLSGPALTITLGQNIYNAGANTTTFTPLKLADGTTNLTISIPATARDSGDVKVFLPVVGGNELIYQCSAQIMLEAWANFQPIFWNRMYGTGQSPFKDQPEGSETLLYSQPVPTFFQYALSFRNMMAVSKAGWAWPKPEILYPTGTQLWDAAKTYALDDFAKDALDVGYQSQQAGNLNHALSDPVWWSEAVTNVLKYPIQSSVVFPLFRELYDDLANVLTLIGGQLGGGNVTTGAGGTGGAGDDGNEGAGGDGGGPMI
jgi:hypothetical protein